MGHESKFLVENDKIRNCRPDLPIHYPTFMGHVCTILIMGSLLMSARIVKRFRSKEIGFGPKFDGFGDM